MIEAALIHARSGWAQLRRGEAGDVAKSWLKASIGIEAHAERDWTVRALVNGEPRGQTYTFEKQR
jgi:hypothetical protein